MKPFHFNGPHRAQSWYVAAKRNREMVLEQCATTHVTPQDLADSVDEDGVDPQKAKKLVETLLTRAKDEAFGKSIGILPLAQQLEGE